MSASKDSFMEEREQQMTAEEWKYQEKHRQYQHWEEYFLTKKNNGKFLESSKGQIIELNKTPFT
jgi:hypothetical protein